MVKISLMSPTGFFGATPGFEGKASVFVYSCSTFQQQGKSKCFTLKALKHNAKKEIH